MKTLKYLGSSFTNQNSIYVEIKCWLTAGNSCYYLVKTRLTSTLFSKNLTIKIFKIILLNVMFHAPMERFQLELIYYFTYFYTVVSSDSWMFLSCRPCVVNTTFSTSTPTRPVENDVLTTKGLQERKIQLLDGTTVER